MRFQRPNSSVRVSSKKKEVISGACTPRHSDCSAPRFPRRYNNSEDSLEDNCDNSSDDNFEMKVVPEMKKQVRFLKVCALLDITKSYIR